MHTNFLVIHFIKYYKGIHKTIINQYIHFSDKLLPRSKPSLCCSKNEHSFLPAS